MLRQRFNQLTGLEPIFTMASSGPHSILLASNSWLLELFIKTLSTHYCFQYWIFEAHSQYYDLQLSTEAPKSFSDDDVDVDASFDVTSHPGVVVTRDDVKASNATPKVYLSTRSNHTLTVLLLVRGYDADHPVPGFSSLNG